MRKQTLSILSGLMLAATAYGLTPGLSFELMVPVDESKIDGITGYGATVPFTTYAVYETDVCRTVSGAKFVRDGSGRCMEAMGWAFAALETTGAGVEGEASDSFEGP